MKRRQEESSVHLQPKKRCKSENTLNLLDQLCTDTATFMLTFLDLTSLYHVSLVNKKWNAFMESDQASHVWKSIFDWYTLGPPPASEISTNGRASGTTDCKLLLKSLSVASTTGIDLRQFAGRHLCFQGKINQSASFLKVDFHEPAISSSKYTTWDYKNVPAPAPLPCWCTWSSPFRSCACAAAWSGKTPS